MKNSLIAGLLLCLPFVVVAQDKPEKLPRLEWTPCPVVVPTGVRADCGKLKVRENRRKSNSRSIELAIAIVRSTKSAPAPDPVIYTAGGPGVSSMGMLKGATNLLPYLAERDFIIFEQRGTGFARPSLVCPEVNEAIHRARRENRADALKLETEAAGLCRKRLVEEGVDLAAYDSASSAADIDDLRKVLGLAKVNLYGISYSTRLMLNYIRDYGTYVRSVILDSVLPLTVNWDETGVDNVKDSLDRLFADCESDPTCKSKYPEVRKLFSKLVASASAKPIEVAVATGGKDYLIRLNGADVVDLFYNLLESTRDLQNIPATVSELSQGNYNALRRYAESLMTGDGFIWGMRYSVWCREEMPFESRKKIEAETGKHPELGGFRIQGAMPEICRLWNIPSAPRIENQAFRSNIPALIFSGEFDPDTPVIWGRMVASWFKQAYFVEAKGISHQVMNNRCSFAEIPAAFLKDPSKRPDTSCMPQTRKWEFK